MSTQDRGVQYECRFVGEHVIGSSRVGNDKCSESPNQTNIGMTTLCQLISKKVEDRFREVDHFVSLGIA
jgi:hypothetical protein